MKKPRTSLWVFSTYFAEGLPYMITRVLASIFFTDMGVRESLLGFLNFLGIPWNLKFLWAPFLDIFSTKRQWLLRMQLLMTVIVFIIAAIAGFFQNTSALSLIAFLFVGMAFLAATNDIAIDAYYLEGLPDKSEQAAYSGLRTLAYRGAVIYTRTGLVAIAGFANWHYGFGVGAVTLGILFLIHQKFLPHFETAKEKTPKSFATLKQDFADSFRVYLSQNKIALILAFIITYKLGDEILFAMNTPFLMRELGVTKPQIAWLGGFVGAFSTIAGTMLGGLWIQKKGLQKAIWPLTIIMNFNIWAYILLSLYKPDPASTMGMTLIALTHGYENIAAGLGSAALTVYLMRLCDVRYKAAHFAIGTAIMSLGSTVFGGFSGIIVEKIGYTNLFLISFVASLPSMILLFWLPLEQKK